MNMHPEKKGNRCKDDRHRAKYLSPACPYPEMNIYRVAKKIGT